jgi:hypothetical protein
MISDVTIYKVFYLTMEAGIAKGWMVEEMGFNFQQGQEIFLFSTAYGPTLGLTQLSSQWEKGGFFSKKQSDWDVELTIHFHVLLRL